MSWLLRPKWSRTRHSGFRYGRDVLQRLQVPVYMCMAIALSAVKSLGCLGTPASVFHVSLSLTLNRFGLDEP